MSKIPFKPAGPPRFRHQFEALKKIIETRGVTALLMAPGTGKTAVTLDYLSLLALYSRGEVRALVVSPKAAVDNWVLQAETYVHPDVSVWAEALGGSVQRKALALGSRGPAKLSTRLFQRKRDYKQAPYRTIGVDQSEMVYVRPPKPISAGPNSLPLPRLILLSTNLEAFSSRQQVGSRTVADILLQGIKRFAPDVVIVDESHRLKGPTSNVSRLMARVSNLAPKRLILTGTVMPKGPLDVYAQWRFLEPKAFGFWDSQLRVKQHATLQRFENRYVTYGGFMGKQIRGYQNLDELQKIMAKNAVVVKKEEALDLPAMTQAVIPFTLSRKEEKAYRELKRDFATELDSGMLTTPNRLTQMLRLRQITAGYAPDDEGTSTQIGTSKNDVIESLVHDSLAGEKRIVVFTVFKHEVDYLRDKLSRKGTEVLVITGATSQADRLKIRQRFGSDDPARIVLVAQIQTLSLSVNELVSASHAIFASLSWRRDDIIQAQDRLHRIGQKLPVTIWVPLARGTVDEVIWKSHQDGTELEAAVLDHVQDNT